MRSSITPRSVVYVQTVCFDFVELLLVIAIEAQIVVITAAILRAK